MKEGVRTFPQHHDAHEISCWIEGDPKPQKRHRHAKRGSATITYDPSHTDKMEFLWKVKHVQPKKPLEGPLKMTVYFRIQRPQSHYRTGKYKHLLKNRMPTYVKARPDLDNYIKFVMDALGKGRFFKDDSQIVIIEAYKVYSTRRTLDTSKENPAGPGTQILIDKIVAYIEDDDDWLDVD